VNRTAAPGDLERRVEEFRAVRETIEASILPLATSVDGRSFTFQASLHGLDLQPGAYVVLEHAAGSRLGQVLSLALATEEATAIEQPIAAAGGTARSRVLARLARGEGTILGGDGRPFHDALARPAAPDEVRAWLESATSRRAQLEVGELALAPGVPCVLDAGGFARHTFMCGQSGSGKTYSLGVVLERLMLETDLPVIVLDPNSDYVHLAEARADVEPTEAARYVNVLSQCDNLLLMRMNSTADLDIVGEAFSFAPSGLRERATAFRQGEALVAGKICSHPALIRFGARFSQEGGGDVPATWAARRHHPA
jgi:uncharacterized protein DUF87